MNSKLEESFKLIEKNKLIEAESKKEKMKEQLISFSIEHNNPFDFKDSGLSEESELIKNRKIKDKILEGLNKESIEIIEIGIESFKHFLMGPIFTDSFHENLGARNEWEKNNIPKLEQLDKKLWEYCISNRLRVNVCYSILEYPKFFLNDILDLDIKKILLSFIDRAKVGFENNENGYPKYHSLNDKDKIKIVGELTEIAEEVILLLTEKIK